MGGKEKIQSKEVEVEVEVEVTEAEVISEEVTKQKNTTDLSVQDTAVSYSIGEKQTAAILSADSWEERLKIADEMIEGGLVPKSFNGEPGTVISAVEMGLELGLGPWAALNNMVVIEGKVTLTLNGMLALARSKGILLKVVEDYKAVKDKSGKVINRVTTVEITRGEDIYSPGGTLLQSSVNIYSFSKYKSEAKTAGLLNKSNWEKMPRNMLRARAISEALRLYAPDVMMGLYESTEIADDRGIQIELKE